MTRQYGSRLIGEKRIGIGYQGALTWHLADQAGRMYRCTCMPSFRIGGAICHPKAGAKKRGWMNHKKA